MKALKEKRISLRSLWRRGLVILSLFALVFASCGDSDSGGDSSSDSAGWGVVSIKVKVHPPKDQYLGMPVDLEGTVLDVYYSNGKHDLVEWAPGKFTAWPRVVTGVYLNNGSFPQDFYGMPGCRIIYNNNVITQGDTLAEFSKVWGIARNDSQQNTTQAPVPIDGLYDFGLSILFKDKMVQTTAYADDEAFDFGGLAVGADYYYYNAKTDTVERDYKTLSFADLTWRILPNYKDKNPDGTYRGWVYITAGADADNWIENYFFGGTLPPGADTRGVTGGALLDVVHTVTKIELANQGPFEPYFYWQPNDYYAWLGRFDEGAELQVSYSDGKTVGHLISDLAEKRKIWYNANPEKGGPGDAYWVPYALIDADFDIVPIQYPLTAKANPNPGIVLYYRGSLLPVPVDVYTTLVSVSATGKNQGGIVFYPDAHRDNDSTIQDDLPKTGGLASLMDVSAVYQAYNDPNKQAVVNLVYRGFLPADPADWDEYTPYYTFGKGGDDSSYEKGYDKWLAQAEKGAKGKASFDQAVTLGHFVEGDEVLPFHTAAGQNLFEYNYVRYGENRDPSYTGPVGNAYKGWRWEPQGNATGDPNGSGLKTAKAKTVAPLVTWVVKE